MDIPVTSREHRILRHHMKGYYSFKDLEKQFTDYPVIVDEGENPLGVYENVPN